MAPKLHRTPATFYMKLMKPPKIPVIMQVQKKSSSTFVLPAFPALVKAWYPKRNGFWTWPSSIRHGHVWLPMSFLLDKQEISSNPTSHFLRQSKPASTPAACVWFKSYWYHHFSSNPIIKSTSVYHFWYHYFSSSNPIIYPLVN